MPYKVTYVDEAKEDIKDAKAWYKKQRHGLQKQFAAEVIKWRSKMNNYSD